MNDNLPFVSVVIPCRNEEKFIAKCLNLLMLQDYPESRLEVVIVDGMSTDKTREIVSGYAKKNPRIRMIDNPQKITPHALNIGIGQARGEIIMLPGAHSFYSPNYVSVCVSKMDEFGADVVSGVSRVIPSQGSLAARAIALCLSSFFGAGNAYYKISVPKSPKWVDTVFGGCYKKSLFAKIGKFDARLARNQDFDLSVRIKKSGGEILLVPDVSINYYPITSLGKFAKHNYDDGYWVIYPLSYGLKTFSWRHLLPLLFILGLFLSLVGGLFAKQILLFYAAAGSYILFNLIFSLAIALKEKNLGLLFIMPAVFFIRHFFYGLGSLSALGAVIINKNGRNRSNSPAI
ncbi:MAG: hypothetical protein YFSK_3950 [Candidatus Yanofskyibacterium parasiticum]|nr:MAG: hypothetical protein YFSK_3950 [Candidatus Yanofskybacteria bacterium]